MFDASPSIVHIATDVSADQSATAQRVYGDLKWGSVLSALDDVPNPSTRIEPRSYGIEEWGRRARIARKLACESFERAGGVFEARGRRVFATLGGITGYSLNVEKDRFEFNKYMALKSWQNELRKIEQ